MKNITVDTVPTFLIVLWLVGITTVKGFWMTLLAIIPPFGMYFAVDAYVLPIITKLTALL